MAGRPLGHEMLVLVRWQARNMAAPLAKLIAEDSDESTAEAISYRDYWIGLGY
jgi:hypothetical protein